MSKLDSIPACPIKDPHGNFVQGPTAKTLPIHEELGNLSYQLDKVEELVDTLSDRLKVAMHEGIEYGEHIEKAEESRSPLFLEIESATVRIMKLKSGLEDILNNLEL